MPIGDPPSRVTNNPNPIPTDRYTQTQRTFIGFESVEPFQVPPYGPELNRQTEGEAKTQEVEM